MWSQKLLAHFKVPCGGLLPTQGFYRLCGGSSHTFQLFAGRGGREERGPGVYIIREQKPGDLILDKPLDIAARDTDDWASACHVFGNLQRRKGDQLVIKSAGLVRGNT